jgi:hypothetical protein
VWRSKSLFNVSTLRLSLLQGIQSVCISLLLPIRGLSSNHSCDNEPSGLRPQALNLIPTTPFPGAPQNAPQAPPLRLRSATLLSPSSHSFNYPPSSRRRPNSSSRYPSNLLVTRLTPVSLGWVYSMRVLALDLCKHTRLHSFVSALLRRATPRPTHAQISSADTPVSDSLLWPPQLGRRHGWWRRLSMRW